MRKGEEILDLENPPPSKGAELPVPAAIEFLADILEAEGGESLYKATEAGAPYDPHNSELTFVRL